MSSRALRKLQREQEQEAQQSGTLREDEQNDSEEEAHDPTELKISSAKKFNAFDMLNEVEEDQSDAHDSEKAPLSTPSSDLEDTAPSSRPVLNGKSLPHASNIKSRSKKKKKNKKKEAEANQGHNHTKQSAVNNTEHPKLDEIDVALLSLRSKGVDGGYANEKPAELSPSLSHLYQLLATDSKNLNALNEMKRLFGSAVLEGETGQAGTPGQGRRRARGPQQVDLGGALAGRNSPVSRGQGLAGLALRRNVFMFGKEEWPKATSGGLGMDVVEKASDHTTEYRFVHNSMYQDVQHQFESCAESLDPQRMIQLLQFNPYHISTLLQVSEIAKQQGDHSVAGDLLERALFSFGRSVHSTFHTTLAKGEARLDFRRPENREFWLASWRYISSLGQRGTWRTAYEWAKLLLSLDPEGDPYCVGLVLDQLALRGGQFEHLIDLADTKDSCFEDWGRFPNIQVSKALAEYRLAKPIECRASLAKAIKDYPWLFARLFQELNIDHIPKSIWGKEARSEREKLESESYVTRAKDLWNTPETVSLLVEAAQSVDVAPGGAINNETITLNEARHVLLSDIPALISLLPRNLTSMRTSASDPLPPPDNLSPYTSMEPSEPHQAFLPPGTPDHLAANRQSPETMDVAQELRGLQSFFSRFIPWLGSRNSTSPAGNNSNQPEEHSVEEIAQAVSDSGIAAEVIEERGTRMMELQQRMIELQRRHLEMTELGQETTEVEYEEAQVNRHRDEDETRAISDSLSNLDEEISHHDTPNQADRITHAGESAGSAGQHLRNTDSEPYDDERNQRWLAGQGLLRLRDFVSENGIDENNWREHGIDTSPVNEYVQRVNLLRRATTRNFILDYVLQQGTSGQVRDLIRSKLVQQ